MVKWEKHRLGDVIELIGGGTPKTSVPEYWNGGIPWLSVKDFNNDNRYVYETEKSITQLGLEHSSTKMLQKDDIIISARGTVGEMAMIPFPMAFNQSCYGVRGRNGLDQTFLYYLIKNCISKLKKITHGSVFDTITRDTFDNITVSVPDKGTQNKIASMLSQYDDKIELNERINKNLSKLAQMLYLQLSDSISGKDEQPLSDIIDIRDGTHDSPKSQTSGHPLITSKHLLPFGVDTLSANFISQSDYDKINERSKVNTYDILFSMIGTVGLVSLVIEENVDFAIKNVGLFKTSEHPDLVPYIFEYLKSYKTSIKIDSCLAGSTQKYISLGELRKLPIVIPTSEQLKNYNSMAKPIIRQIASLTAENKALAKLRDSLLPKLMSGEIDVSNISL